MAISIDKIWEVAKTVVSGVAGMCGGGIIKTAIDDYFQGRDRYQPRKITRQIGDKIGALAIECAVGSFISGVIFESMTQLDDTVKSLSDGFEQVKEDNKKSGYFTQEQEEK